MPALARGHAPRQVIGWAVSSIVKVAPRSSPALEAVSWPPWASSTDRLIARPEPEAAVAPLLLRVPLLERVEDPGQAIGLDADAGVGHLGQEDRARLASGNPPVGFQVRIVILPPRGVNLAAFLMRFQNTCCSRAASPCT